MAGKRENQAGKMEQASEFLIPGKYYSHSKALAVAQFGVCLFCPAFFLFAVFQVTAQPGWRIVFAVLLLAGSGLCVVQVRRIRSYLNMRYALSDAVLYNYCGEQCRQCRLEGDVFVSKVDLRASGKFSFSVHFVLISRKPIPADLWQYSEDLARWMQYAWEREVCLIPLEAYEKEKPLPLDPPRYPNAAYLPGDRERKDSVE